MVAVESSCSRQQRPQQHSRRMRTRYTKENDGNTRRQQIRTHIGRALASFCVMCISLAALVRLTRIHPSDAIDDGQKSWVTDNYKRNRAGVIARRYQRNDRKSDTCHDSVSNERRKDISVLKADMEKVNLILSGKLHLVDIKIKRNLEKLSEYEGVLGEFCPLAWSHYKSDPSSTPMFKDLVKYSCHPRNTFTYDLRKIVELATASDDPTVHAIKPGGFIFHESRCGSTLAANALAAMDQTHRVYSESQPPIKALKACGINGARCAPHVAAELFQDVVYLMGRTGDATERGLFFKVQSLGSKYLDVATEAFPDTPWIFVYRDPVQIMMSQLAHGVDRANCARQALDVSEDKSRALAEIGRTADSLTPIERCAVHLSTLCDAAIVAIARSMGMGIGVNYKNLVNKLIEHIIPQHFQVVITEERRERIIDVGGKYSKGRAHKAKEWEEDSDDKDNKASPEVRGASKTFLYESYNALENR